jgi:hypothetical protein
MFASCQRLSTVSSNPREHGTLTSVTDFVNLVFSPHIFVYLSLDHSYNLHVGICGRYSDCQFFFQGSSGPTLVAL